jgi:AcrR family transcriptional regulator
MTMEAIRKILSTAERMFMRFGIRSVTMDDVARETSISKKTLYRCFRDKDELVQKTVEQHLKAIGDKMDELDNQEGNAVMNTLAIANFICSDHRELNPALIFDLRKYHAESYALLTRQRDQMISTRLLDNLNKGMLSGLYRNDMNPELISRFYINSVDSLFNEDGFPGMEFDFVSKYRELIHYHLHGIVTPEGKKILDNIQI